MRAVIYARVSSEEQKNNNSLPTQIAACERYAEQYGMTVVAILQDTVSGSKLDRPGLAKVRDLIRLGAIDAVIVYSADRWTRSLAHHLLLRDELRAAGVVQHSVTKGQASVDTLATNPLENIESSFAEFERLKIKERTARGRKARAESGKLLGGGTTAPYGYRFVGDQNKRDGFEIIEEEARVLHMIAAWLLSGISVLKIRRKLSEMRVLAPGDTRRLPTKRLRPVGEWGLSSLYSILHNPVYKGKCAYRFEGEVVYIAVPPIFDDTTWQSIQAQIATRQRLNSHNNPKHVYLLRGRVRCGECKRAYVGQASGKQHIYRCPRSGRPDAVVRCSMPQYNAHHLEATIWAWIDQEILSEAHIRSAVEKRVTKYDPERARLVEQYERCFQQLADLDQQSNRLAQLFTAGLYTLEEIAQQKAILDSAKEGTKAETDRLNKTISGIIATSNTVDELCEIIQLLRKETSVGALHETKCRIMELLGLKVTLVCIEKARYIDVECELTLDVARLSFHTPPERVKA
jgi:site-specific DNA recombinase